MAAEPRSDFLATQEDFHIACLRIVYKGQFMGEIYLHRSKEKPDFGEEDMFVLRLLQPHIATVFHIIHTVRAANDLETEGGRLARRGLCLFDEELSLIGGNAAGYEMLKTATVFGSSVLYHVKELCEDLRAAAKGSPHLLHQGERFKTGSGSLLADLVFYRGSGRAGQFFLCLAYEDGEQAIADYKFKFTKREADIIDGVVQGKNNAQLAAGLNLSENTVKTHIQSIYRKVGANNRTELAYILMISQGPQG